MNDTNGMKRAVQALNQELAAEQASDEMLRRAARHYTLIMREPLVITRCDDPTCTRADCDNAETADEHAAREANRTYWEHDTEPQQASQAGNFNTPNNTPNGGWW
jgi:hypothetical protein